MASKKQRKTEATINSLRASFYQLDLPKQKALIEALRKQPIVKNNDAYLLFLEECTAYYAQGVFYKQEQDRLKRQEAEAARLRAIESFRERNPIRNTRRAAGLRSRKSITHGRARSRTLMTSLPPKRLSNCTACGRERIDDMIFCIFCAHRYEVVNEVNEVINEVPQVQETITTEADLCENCGAEKIPNNKFCTSCGHKFYE